MSSQDVAALAQRERQLEDKLDELIRLLKPSEDEDVSYAARRADNT